jgi:hypothetical protein
MGFGLVNGFIDHLHARLGTTSTYKAIADLHALKITRLHPKSSQYDFISPILTTNLNNGDSSAYVVTPLLAG